MASFFQISIHFHPCHANLKKVEASSVLKSLTGVKINKATGIDKISNKILKIAAPIIYKNLTDLFIYLSPLVYFHLIGK